MEVLEKTSIKNLMIDFKEKSFRRDGYILNILGTEWTVKVVDELSNPDIDGLCCSYNKTIYLLHPKSYGAYSYDEEQYRFLLIARHEIIHAFVFESGFNSIEVGDEQTTDWLAYQFDKIKYVFDLLKTE